MRRGTLVVLAGLFVFAGCGGAGHDEFRAMYEGRATYGDKFAEPPPDLTDEQIDEIYSRVCVDGEPVLDEADEIGRSLAGGIPGSATLGSAIFQAVKHTGCP